jgi:hypothetical protein
MSRPVGFGGLRRRRTTRTRAGAGVDGMCRTEAARISGFDRQSLQNWGYRFNNHALDGWKDTRSKVARHARHQTGGRSWPGSGRAGRRVLVAHRPPAPHRQALRRRFPRVLKQIGFSRINVRLHHPAREGRPLQRLKLRHAEHPASPPPRATRASLVLFSAI